MKKYFFALFLFTLFVYSPLLTAQTGNKSELIKKYQKGDITNPNSEEKQIISEYLKSINQSNNVSLVRIISPESTIFFEEDFSGQTLPTGWTNVSNIASQDVWQFDNPGERDITGSFDADFAILDSDYYGDGNSQNASLTTIAIDASLAQNLKLGFDQQFQALDDSYGLVQVSNDNLNWITIDSITVDTGYPNPPVYSEYDITLIAAGESTVYIRWTYSGTWAWWWAIDNVVIYEAGSTPNPAILISPINAGTNISILTALDWMAGGGTAPDGYRIYFGTDGGGVTPPTNIENNNDLGLVTTYIPASPLLYNTTYYWMIVPYTTAGYASGTPIWSFTTLAPETLPFSEDFEAGTSLPPGWDSDMFVNNSHGTSGSNGLNRNLWSAKPTAYATTPVIGPLALGAQLEFDYRIVDWDGYPSTPTTITNDVFDIQVSTDGGENFTTVYTINSANHVTSVNFANIVVPLGAFNGKSVMVKWDLQWYTGDYYFDIDNVLLHEIPLDPLFSINPASKDFGLEIAGNSSAPQNFTITNIGGSTLTINSGGITLTGADADQFTLDDSGVTYPINLNASQSAVITVTFTPTITGTKTANLEIVHNAPDTSTIVPLTGKAFPPGVLLEDFSGLTFPPDNWLAINNDAGTNTWYRSTDNFNSQPASTGSDYEPSEIPNDDWLITPGLSVVSGDSLTFLYRALDTALTESMVIKIGNTNNPNGNWIDIDSIADNTTNWKFKSYDLSEYAGLNVYIAFVNRGLDQSTIYIDDVTGPLLTTNSTTFQLSLALENGWNMVSIPGLHPINQEVETWWAGKDPANEVFEFNEGYYPVTEAEPGKGYWLNHSGAATYSTGNQWPEDGFNKVENYPITGNTGWNLIGGYHYYAATSGITTDPPGSQAGSIFKYSGGYSAVTALQPGYGYWMKLTQSAQIHLPDPLFDGLTKFAAAHDTWGKLILTDNAGRSYTLFVVNEEVNLDEYELPPLPPAGMFDVRYGSQRYAEDLSKKSQTILMSAMEYPVTLRTERVDIKLQDVTGKIINESLKAGEQITINDQRIQKLIVSEDKLPANYFLEQNYPNPFNPVTTIGFSIPQDSKNVKLTIYNVLGQEVAELINSELAAGKYSYQWDAGRFASGMYIYELRADKFVSVKKMLMIK